MNIGMPDFFNNDCKPKAFWLRTSGNEMIGQLIREANAETYESLSALMQGKEVQAVIDTDIIYPELNGDPDVIYSFYWQRDICGLQALPA